MYTATAGFRAQQINLNTIADNLSNINTTDYRSRRAEFNDALYRELNNISSGNGTIISTIEISENYGTPRELSSGSNVDLAEEMVCLIRAQKMFSVLCKSVVTADEMERLASSLIA